VDHELSQHIVKLAVHKTTLLAIEENLGLVTETVLEDELRKLNSIESKINRIVLLKGKLAVTDTVVEVEDELLVLEAELLEDWDEAASLDYLNGFGKRYRQMSFLNTLSLDLGTRFSVFKIQ
jgi:hypothetical protein